MYVGNLRGDNIILTIIYLIVCFWYTTISIDYHILAATVVLDVVGMIIGGWVKKKKSVESK